VESQSGESQTRLDGVPPGSDLMNLVAIFSLLRSQSYASVSAFGETGADPGKNIGSDTYGRTDEHGVDDSLPVVVAEESDQKPDNEASRRASPSSCPVCLLSLHPARPGLRRLVLG
jgi:hypothetical protein